MSKPAAVAVAAFPPMPSGTAVVPDVANPSAETTACFSVHAEVDPGVMPRVLELFAKRGLVPTTWHSRIGGLADAELTIDLQMRGMAQPEARVIAAQLRQLPTVAYVLTSERFYAGAD